MSSSPDSASLLRENGVPDSLWCGYVDCNDFGLYWRKDTGNRKFWKVLSSFTLIGCVGAYIYTRMEFPIMTAIGILWLVKNLVTIWGQETPTVFAPGNWFVFFLAYGMGIPSVIWMFAGCPGTGDLVFPNNDIIGLVLVVFGLGTSYTYEVQRFNWKQLPENRGRLHTVGLARFSMHPNYFGDLFTYIGWTIASGSRCGFGIAAFQMALFVWFWIPSSDAYLAQRYSSESPQYAAKTASIIPFVRSSIVNHTIAFVGFVYACYASTFCSMRCGEAM